MARRKKRPARRPAPDPAPQPAAEAPASAVEPAADALFDRLSGLRDRLAAGDMAGALAALDGWLGELRPAERAAEESAREPEEPPPAPDEPPPDPVAAGLLQPLDAPGPRFSVLMAAYNRSELIGEAIESVLVQAFADWELVIVDDGSTDETPAVVGRYAEAEPRIRYIRKPRNEGRSPTRSRAVAEARGEYVLWMADDDLLAPDLLATYDAALRETPVDVIYGKLQLFEAGRDLDVYTPNDWTGRERRLLGAELYGSCIPDGGTATRRALLAKVGAPIYDPEFARAQDYELWTRLLPHARVRMLDRVVYRYRKHDGGTSWGPFVDLSYDSKIIRRHLSRHPLEALFVTLDWSDPSGARRAAMRQIGELMIEYQDPRNAERFLAAADTWGPDPRVTELRVRGRLMAGDSKGAERLIDGFIADWPGHHPLAERLREQLAATAELARTGEAAIAAGRPSEAENRAVAHHNRFGLGYHVCLLRGRARVAGGDRREGLWFLCQAARLNVGDARLADEARALAAELGIDGPKVDIGGMRRRLGEVFSEPVTGACPDAGPTTITAVIIAEGGDVARAVASALNQRRAPREVLVVGASSPDPRALAVAAADDPQARRAAAIAAATSDAIAWLTADSAWTPDHLSRLGAALDAGAGAAWGDGHQLDADTGDTTYAPPIAADRSRLLADDLVPLSALMHRRALAPEPVSGPCADWIFTLDLAWALDREADFARVGAPTWVGPPATPSTDRAALERVFARHPTPLLFAPAARARQAERLAPLGSDWPLKGRTGVVIIGGDDLAAFEQTLDAIEAHTRCPHAVVVVADGPSPETRAGLIARCAGHALIATPRPLGPAKALNLGLSRAGGDRVAIVRAGVTPTDGWLGRMRWWLAQGPEALALALPAGRDGAEARIERPDDRCLLVTRAALDAIGGADLALDPTLALDDWLLRLRAAGFGWRATDVAFAGGVRRFATPADPDAAPRFRTRWGGLPLGDRLPALPEARPPLHHPYGAEEGFRYDIPPVEVHDGEGGPRVLMQPPWRDAEARRALLAALAELPDSVRVWLRVAPGDGPAARDAFAEKPPPAPLWIVDAPLAPDREGGLFTAADAVYVDDRWPDAAEQVRRAYDCGRPPLRTPAALRRWAEARRTP